MVFWRRQKLLAVAVGALLPFVATLLITLVLYVIWRRVPSIPLGDSATVLVTTIPALAGLWAMSRCGIRLNAIWMVLYFLAMLVAQALFWLVLAAEVFGLGL